MKIVAGWGDLLVSRTISICSSRPYRTPMWAPSHIAVIVNTTPEVELITGEKKLWVESSALIERDCILHKKRVVGLQAHKIEDRCKDYPRGNVLTYRLRKNYELSEYEEEYLSQMVFEHIWHHEYDCPPCGWFQRFVKFVLFKNQNTLLCSEFAHDLLIHLGRSSITNPCRCSPGSFLSSHIRDGILIKEGPLLTAPS